MNSSAPTPPPGLWPVMLTPFRDDGTVDWAGVDGLTDAYLAAGAAGLFACCLSSEGGERGQVLHLALGGEPGRRTSFSRATGAVESMLNREVWHYVRPDPF